MTVLGELRPFLMLSKESKMLLFLKKYQIGKNLYYFLIDVVLTRLITSQVWCEEGFGLTGLSCPLLYCRSDVTSGLALLDLSS